MNIENIRSLNIDANKLADVEELPEKDITEINQDEEVFISIPKFFYEARDDINNTEKTQNMRVINLKNLIRLIQIGIKIEDVDTEDYDNLLNTLLYEIKSNSETTEMYLDFAKMVKEIVFEFEIKQDYDTFNSLGIEFDKIRTYNCNRNSKLLEGFETSSYNGKEFYSLLNPEEILIARIENNDTDYNRCQYVLSMFEKSYAFEPNRTYNKFTNYIMLTLFCLAILTQSHPVKGYCSNDLFVHYISIMIDTLIRSRHINVWLEKAYSNHFNLDYKPTNANDFNKIYKLRSSKERFEQFASLINDNIVRNQKYENYLNIINKNILSVENKCYYNFNLDYLFEFLSSQPVQSLSKKMNK